MTTCAEWLIDIGNSIDSMSKDKLKKHCRALSIKELDAMRLALRFINAPANTKAQAVSKRWGMKRIMEELNIGDEFFSTRPHRKSE
jgi:hypothetical protein